MTKQIKMRTMKKMMLAASIMVFFYMGANGQWSTINCNGTSTVNFNGNVGIGNSCPSYGLDVWKPQMRLHQDGASPILTISNADQTYWEYTDIKLNEIKTFRAPYSGNSLPSPDFSIISGNLFLLPANNVGIGGNTLDGQYKLEVFGKTLLRDQLLTSGEVGIGGNTLSGSYKLEVFGNTMLHNQLDVEGGIGSYSLNAVHKGTDLAAVTNLLFGSYDSDQPNNPGLLRLQTSQKLRFLVKSNGQVGIGTDPGNSEYLLTVKGKIKAEEVEVVMDAAADYVFEKNYRLMPLKDLEAFVNAEKHLPEVPSASEFKEKGLKIAEMNNTLLKKVEELTLYAIAQNKKQEEMLKQLEELKKENEQVKKELKEMKGPEKP